MSATSSMYMTTSETPSAPDLSSDTSGPFTFPSFCDQDNSVSSENSTNSSFLPSTTSAESVSGCQFTCAPNSTSGTGLGFIGIFQQDGMPYGSSKIFNRDNEVEGEEEDEMSWFEFDHSPRSSSSLFDEIDLDINYESQSESKSLEDKPSPRLLDRVFSSLAIMKPNIFSTSLPRGFEEPTCDNAFIQIAGFAEDASILGPRRVFEEERN